MSIETATFVGDLQPANPPSTDPRGQGDDHLRLIKQVLQNSFPSMERAFIVPSVVSKSASYSIIAGDQGKIFYTSTGGGAVVYTLPSGLASTDAGWEVSFIKTTGDANAIFIAPATGTLNSGGVTVSRARRCVSGIRFRVFWDGTGWFVERCLTLPIGSMIDFAIGSLPAGYEWPNGQTLASASTNYPEYNFLNANGSTFDMRGRVAVTLDNLGGSSAGRLAGGVINGTGVGNTGGTDTVTLTTTNIPANIPNSLNISGSISDTGQSNWLSFNHSGALNYASGSHALGDISALSLSLSGSVTINSGGGGAHSNLQPSIMCSKILVVE